MQALIDEPVTIRSLQHFLYCEHRWGLMEIDRAWKENYFVTKANIIHERVHGDISYSSKGKKIYTSVYVYNDEYNLVGELDCLELIKSSGGVSIKGETEKYTLCIVEYKPTEPSSHNVSEEDLIQLFAQKLCVDSLFKCDCKTVMYYADVKKRTEVNFSENYDYYVEKIKTIIKNIRYNIKNGIIPPIKKGQKCSGCSLKSICMPSTKKPLSVKKQILTMAEEIL